MYVLDLVIFFFGVKIDKRGVKLVHGTSVVENRGLN